MHPCVLERMDSNTARLNRPKSRQSIAHIPSANSFSKDKENVTADVSTMQGSKITTTKAEKKKLRSKSLGPGGLEALNESTGNTAKVFVRQGQN